MFWTIIYCLLLKSQVEDVNAKFAALEKLKNNNWKEEEKKTRKVIKKSKAKVLSGASYIIFNVTLLLQLPISVTF